MRAHPAALVLAAGLLLPIPAVLAQVQITIDSVQRRQTIEGLGATATGTWNPDIAALFLDPAFATQVRDDLGLSMVRLDLPAEIQKSPDLQPTVLDPARFDFTVMQPTGKFAANLNRGAPGSVKVIGTIWSPPAWMKTNGDADHGGELRPDRVPHFAKFCAGSALGFDQAFGTPLYALSPQNEPVFWEPYHSCTYSPEGYRDAVAAVAAAFSTWHVPARVYGPEDVGTDPPRWLTFVTTTAGNPAALQRIDAWAIHGYPWQNGQDATSPQAWSSLRQQVQPLGKPIWVSEISGEDPQWLGTAQNPRGALAVARQIQDALVYGEVTAYVYWAIADPVPSQYALMDRRTPTKKYYAARQFYRAIRPGAVRIAATGFAPGAPVSASAFVHDQQHTITLVLINSGADAAPVQLSFAGAAPQAPMGAFRTSGAEDGAVLPPVPVSGSGASLTLPAHSVTTLTGPTEPPPTACYANCDASTAPPLLNSADFTCFLLRFASGDPWANCDASTTAPTLNVSDFTCFLQRFGAGCP